jgi:xanthine dehydrogenase accessory factor
MKIFEDLSLFEQKKMSYALVTLLDTRGGAPQDPGAKMLVSPGGHESGTVGGGKIELYAINEAKNFLKNKQKKPVIQTLNLQTDIGMTCGGEVTLLFELFNSEVLDVVIFGAGHVAQALCEVLKFLSFRVTCVDSRKDWLEKLPSYVNAQHLSEPKDFVEKCSPESFFISMTMGHAFDLPVLKSIFEYFPEAGYVGVIGSETKGRVLKNDLLKAGVAQSFCDKIRIPIGLPLGNNDPHEIAISICAELLKVRDTF